MAVRKSKAKKKDSASAESFCQLADAQLFVGAGGDALFFQQGDELVCIRFAVPALTGGAAQAPAGLSDFFIGRKCNAYFSVRRVTFYKLFKHS